ncbi:MAG: hypothetical protein IK122_02065, partial [Alphaproteobacteria bacterium]|nr:hypothetical protein [Alphaproteobacteria bacterium]
MKTKMFFLAAILYAFIMNAQAQFSFNFWSMTGDALTSSTANSFLGTTNSYPLVFKTNDTLRMHIASNGNIGINTNDPKQMLHIYNGNILISAPPQRAPGSTNGSIMFGEYVNT